MRELTPWSVVILLSVFLLGAPAAAEEPTASGSDLAVAAAGLGRGVEDRELVGEDSTFVVNERVYLWMRVIGGPADSIAVTWRLDDAHEHEHRLGIGGSPWRTWACRTAWRTGSWTVTVTDSRGNLLKRMSFLVEKSPEPERVLGE